MIIFVIAGNKVTCYSLTRAIATILGSLIPQREDRGVYYAIYGGLMAPLLIKLGFTNVFYSFWNIILAIFLGLNLLWWLGLLTADGVGGLSTLLTYRSARFLGNDYLYVNGSVNPLAKLSPA